MLKNPLVISHISYHLSDIVHYLSYDMCIDIIYTVQHMSSNIYRISYDIFSVIHLTS